MPGDVSSFPPPRRRPTLRHRLWQFRRRWPWRRVVRSPWLLVALVLGAAGVGWFAPDLRASDLAGWLREPDRMIAWTRKVAVLQEDAESELVVLRPPRTPGSDGFQLCVGRRLPDCVVDGDTIRYRGVKIRLADIDTPEVFSPKCAHEANLGRRATERLLELINAGPFEVARTGHDEDRYGRKLRVLERNGRSLGAILVAEGLARRWDGTRRSWCG